MHEVARVLRCGCHFLDTVHHPRDVHDTEPVIGVITTSMNEAKDELLAEEKEAENQQHEGENDLHGYTQARLLQIEEIIHTMAEEFKSWQQKKKASGKGCRVSIQ